MKKLLQSIFSKLQKADPPSNGDRDSMLVFEPLESRVLFSAVPADVAEPDITQDDLPQAVEEQALASPESLEPGQATEEQAPPVSNTEEVVSEANLVSEINANTASTNLEERREIVIIAAGVYDSDEILANLDPSLEIIQLDDASDGMEQIAAALDGESGIDAIHLISHGSVGSLSLGNTVVDLGNLASQYQDELGVIGSALSENADLLLYGCDVAAGEAGATFLEVLSEATGADVAASEDHTGAADLGGDWDLEIEKGIIETTEISLDAWNHLLAPGIILIPDDGGDEDEAHDPSDITALSVDYTNQASGQISVTVQLDETANSGSNTSNVAMVFDTDGDGNSNYGFALSLGGDPVFQAQQFSLFYGAADNAGNKIGGSKTTIGQWIDPTGWETTGTYLNAALGTTYALDTVAVDPFSGDNDTRVTLTVDLDDILVHWQSLGNTGATYSDIRLKNAMTQPSHSASSNPKDLGIGSSGPYNAVNDTATTDEDTPVSFNVATNDNAALAASTVELNTAPSNGSVSIGANGLVTYTPNDDFSGVDSFTYNIYGIDGVARTATATVTVNPVADPPVANDDDFAANEDDATAVIGNAITNNDTDPDGDTMTATVQTGVAGSNGGLFSIAANGDVTFDPNNDFESLAAGETDTTTLTYTISDGNGGNDSATITVTVTGENDTPTTVGTVATQNDDDGDAVSLNVSGSFSDPDTSDIPNLTFDDGGTLPPGLSIDANTGVISGTLDTSASATGPFTVVITAEDPSGAQITQTFTWNVTNPGPVAADDSFTADEDDASAIVGNAITNVAGLDTDEDALIATVQTGVTGSNGGLFSIAANGDVTFDPNGAFESLAVGETDTTTLTYVITDADGATDTASITVTVSGENDAPTTVGTVATQNDDDGDAVSLNVSGSFSDPDTSDIPNLTFDDGGTLPPGLSIDANTGVISGTLDTSASATGPFTVVITAEDPSGAQITQTFTWNVTNPGPVAADDSFTADEDDASAIVGNAITNVAGLDTDEDALIATVQTGVTGSNGGLFSIAANGDVTFDPNGAFESLAVGETDTTTLTYVITDADGATDTATITVTVSGENDAPTTVGTVATQNDDDGDAVSLNVSGSFSDPDTSDIPNLTFDDGGTLPPGLSIDANTGVISGTLDTSASATGPFTVVITAEDPSGAQITQTFTWNVTNPGPVAADDSFTADEDDASAIVGNAITNVAGLDTDEDALIATVQTGVTGSNGGLFSIAANGDVTFDPNGAFESLAVGETDTTTLTYVITDADGATDTATITVTVSGENDAPTTVGTVATQNDDDGDAVSLNVSGSFSDPDTSDIPNLTFDDGGTLPPGLSIDANTGVISGTLDTSASATGPFTVVITAEDPSGAQITQTFTWNVTNPGPVAADDSFTADEDDASAIVGNAITNVAGLDTDEDALIATVQTGVTGSNGGLFSIAANGDVTFDPNGAFESLAVGETDTTTLTYVITDADGATDTATITVTVSGENDAPTTVGTVATQNDDDGDAVSLNVSGSFSDPDTSDIPNLTFDDGGTLPPGLSIDANTGVISGTLDTSASATGPFTVVITAEDPSGAQITQTFTWNVTNPDPVAVDDSYAAFKDDAAAVVGNAITNLAGLDSDPDGDTLSAQVQAAVAGSSGGLFSIDVNGNVTFDPNGDFAALTGLATTDTSFTYTLVDADGATDTATVTVTVSAGNDPPVANDDSFSADEDDASAVIGNAITNIAGLDTDPDGDALSAIAASGSGSNGGLFSIAANGNVTFDPNGEFEALAAGQTDTTTYSYTVTDPSGATDTATITVTVTGENDAPTTVGTVATQNDNDGDTISLDVSGNFSDPDTTDIANLTFDDGGTLPPGLSIDPNTGEITGDLDSSASQGGPLSDGVYSVTITAEDPSGQQITQTFTWNVANPDPIAVDDSFTADEDDASAVIGNAITNVAGQDTDEDALTATIQAGVAGSSGGLFSIAANGDVTFDPNGDFESLAVGETDTTTLTYTITDADGATDTATVTVTVTGENDAPTTVGTVATQNDNDGDTISLDVSGAFSDPDTSDIPNLTFTDGGTLPPGLSIDLNTGEITGDLDSSASTGGPYSVIITAEDPSGQQITQTFTWNVANPGPTANDDDFAADEDDASAVVGNAIIDAPGTDTDPDGDTLTATVQTGVAGSNGGLFSLAANGDVTFDPNGDFESLAVGETDTTTLTYTITDADGATDTAVVTVTVTGENDAPITVGTVATQNDNDGDTISLDVSGAFSDPDTSDIPNLTFTDGGTLPPGLSIDLNTGEITGDLDSSASTGGPYSVIITAEDPSGQQITQTFTWNVANPGPTANNDNFAADEDDASAVVGNAITDAPGTDTDPDGDTLTATAQTGVAGSNGGIFSIAANGDVTFNPDGDFESLAVGETDTTTLTYTITDADGATDTAVVTVTVTGENDDPVVNSTIGAVNNYDSDTVSLNVSGSFSDPDGDTLTFSDGGTLPPGLSIDPNTGIISGTIDSSASASGPYNVQITVEDPSGQTVTANLITWNVANRLPNANDDAYTATKDDPAAVVGNAITDAPGTDTDPDGDTLGTNVQTSVAGSNGGLFSIDANGNVTFDPNGDFAGLTGAATQDTTFTYTLVDADGGTDTATITVTVDAGNTPPIADNDSFTVDEDGSVTIDVLDGDSDPDGDTLTITQVDGQAITDGGPAVNVANGTVALVAGELVFTPTPDFHGPASFTYTISDSNGGTDTATVSGTVNSVAEAVTIDSVAGTEGDTLTFTATLDNAVAGGFTVDVSTLTGTADSDDYTALALQTLTFTGTAGETVTFTVDTTDDSLIENAESFSLILANVSNGAVDITDTGTGTIADNDARPTTPPGSGVTTDVELVANGSGGFDLVIEDVETESLAGFNSEVTDADSFDNLLIERVGTNYVITDTGGLTLGSPVTGAWRNGLSEIIVPVAMVTGDIVIRTGIDDDTVTVGDLGASLAGGLFIDTEDGSNQFNDFDTIDYGSVSTMALGSDSRFQAETITGLTSSRLEASGDGTVFWDAGRNILMSAGSEVASDTGDITYEANLAGQFTDNFAAIVLKGAEINSTSGDIALTGRAGNTGVYNRGVLLYLDAATATTSAITTGGDASIAITGTGGGSSLFGTGVEAIAATLSAAGTGSVSIDGTGGDGTMFNDGVSLQKFTTVDAGTGEIALNGTGGSTGQFNRGLNLGASSFDTLGGNIFLDGTGGGTGMYGKGVQTTMSDFTTSGVGTITILGTGADGTMGGMGVHLASGSSFNTQDGDIRVEGTGDGSTMLNHGVQVTGVTEVNISGSGNVTMIGTGGAGTTLNRGIDVSHSSIQIADGAITLTGSSLGSGSSNTGITIAASQLRNTGANAIALIGSGSSAATGFINMGVFLDGSSIDALGSANVTLAGTGGSGSMSNMGVKLGAGSSISLASGDLAITGTGDGTSMMGIGVSIEAASSLTAGLNGDVTIAGLGANGTMMNDGVRVASFSTITTHDGNLTITGTGQGTLHLNNGVKLTHSTLSSTGLGNISVIGTGSQSASGIFNVGVNMWGGNLSTLSGSLTLDGQSGTGSTLNQGIRIIAANLGSTGGGAMSLTGRASGSTTGVLNSGVYLLSVGLNTSGSIGITGIGGGGTLLNHGIYMGGITATGSTPTTSGTAGAGSMSDDEDGNFFA